MHAPQSQRIDVKRSASHLRPVDDTSVQAPAVVPVIELFSDVVFLDRDGYSDRLEELEAPLMRLSFRYPGMRRLVRASEPGASFVQAGAAGVGRTPRNLLLECNARRLLESYGAVDLECLDDVGVPPDIDADYMVRLDGDVHDCCSFTAQAIPALEARGWQIEIADDYPYQVVEETAEWVADVRADSERPDWFALQLGVRVEGKVVDLLPVFLELLDRGNDGDSLSSIGPNRKIAVPVSKTHHMSMPQDQIRGLLRVVVELYEGSGGLLFHKNKAHALQRLDEAFADTSESLQWHDPDGARDHAEALRSTDPRKVAAPQELRATLRPYQQVGLEWLQHLRAAGVGGILADDMGLGKTLQTIAHLATEKAAGRMDLPTMIVAPTSLMGNWRREITKFAPHISVVEYHGPQRKTRLGDIPGADVVLTSYPILTRDQEILGEQLWHFMILDEAQAIKNRRSQTHLAARSIESRYRLCLTGTPVENHLGELYSLIDFLNPDMLGDARFFQSWYRVPIEKDGDEDRLMALHEQVSPFILRRLKSEVATELPPKTEVLRPVELKGKQRELYEAIRIAAHAKVRNTIRKKGFAGSTIAILDALMKLRQLCCDPALVKMDAARFVKTSAKTQALFSLVETQLKQGHRILIFSQFTSMLKIISQGLKTKKVKHLTLTGATKDRQGLCDRFEAGEADVFLISLKAGGTGLNLVSADTVIHVDPWWNPQAQAQATDRAYRIGQQKPVFVYNLFVAGSVEERMLALQKKKRRLADAILAGELPQDTGLDEGDIEQLLAPLFD